MTPGDDAARAMSVLLRKITGFSGLVHENMYRFTGWRFLSIGRSLERALDDGGALACARRSRRRRTAALDLAVEIGDSVMSHRRRYAVTTTPRDGDRPARARHAEPALDPLPADRDPRARRASCPTPRATASCRDCRGRCCRCIPALAVETPETRRRRRLLGAASREIEALSDLLSDTYLR